MVDVIRTTAVWTGGPGLPGYSQFYQQLTGSIAAQAQVGHDAVRALFAAIGSLIPEEVTVAVDPLFQVLDAATGALISEGTVGTASDSVPGSFVGGWSARFGVLVEWVTVQIINGRHLRGRTYLVPLGNIEDADGTLPAGTIATVEGGANSITTSETGEFVVWHRPVSGAGGSVAPISGRIVRDHPAVLRSRMI